MCPSSNYCFCHFPGHGQFFNPSNGSYSGQINPETPLPQGSQHQPHFQPSLTPSSDCSFSPLSHAPAHTPSHISRAPATHHFQFQHTFANSYGSSSSQPLPSRPALSDATGLISNAHAPATRRGQKRPAPDAIPSTGRAQKRVRRPPVYGVGPPVSGHLLADNNENSEAFSEFEHPALTQSRRMYGSLVSDRAANRNTSLATDVWYCVRGLTEKERPSTLPEVESTFHKSRPKTPFVGCRFCIGDNWRVWSNTNSQTESIRKHLKKSHLALFRQTVVTHKLKGWETFDTEDQEAATPKEQPPFSLDGFLDRLVKWIAADDQSINVVESLELRDLLLYIGTELEEKDIPHRTKLTELIYEQFQLKYKKLIEEIKNAAGRVSLTSDMWSANSLRSYMAITAHFTSFGLNGEVIMTSRLIAFRYVSGAHDGRNLAKIFVQILQELGIFNRIGGVTLDNASNCASMMEFVSIILQEMGIPFDKEGNRIRCFPHIVNLSVQAGLKQLTMTLNFEDEAYESDDDIDNNNDNDPEARIDIEADDEYMQILRDDVVAAAHNLVTACRASGQRRERFAKSIIEGNMSGVFGPDGLPVLTLLREMEVRWSSTYLMIDRILLLYPAIDIFLTKPENESIAHCALSSAQLSVLADIRLFLSVPHAVQELVSAEKTPTLPIVLPAYERLIHLFKLLKRKLPKLAPAIQASINKLEKYLSKTRTTRMYALAIIINPTIKFQWIEKNWRPEERTAAKKWVGAALLEYRRALRASTSPLSEHPLPAAPLTTVTAPSASRAAQAQISGVARLNAIERELSSESVASIPSTSTQLGPDNLSPGDKVAAEEAEDKQAVREEWNRYISDGIIEGADLEDFDLLRFWTTHKRVYPLLFRIALDILPVQASSVPCERVFSSSKETDTLRRSQLSPVMMEVLQMLKFMVRSEGLDFNDNWVTREKDMTVADIDPVVLQDMIARRQISDLSSLISNAV